MLSTSLASLTVIWGALLLLNSNTIVPAVAFAPSCLKTTPPAKITAAPRWQSRSAQKTRRSTPRDLSTLSQSNKDDDPSNNNSPFQRFLSPQIDDPGLPLTDVLLAQVVAPTFQIYWLLLNHAPNPSWLQPIGSYFGEAPELAPRGSFLAPTLIHGAGLAVCWLAGALAAKAFEREAFTVKGTRVENSDDKEEESGMGLFDTIGKYDTILLSLVKAGAFASGILIISTQLDLLLEFKGFVQFGESDETDFRLVVASVEVINDIVWEALVISSWRIIHANYMSSPDNRLRRF